MVQAVASTTSRGITIRRRHPLIGAEMRGIRLGQVDDGAFRRIYDAWLEHLLLVFPEQDVTDEEQIAFARRFGELEIHPSREHRSSRHPRSTASPTSTSTPTPSVCRAMPSRRWTSSSPAG